MHYPEYRKQSKAFLKSLAWKELRQEVFQIYDCESCMRCRSTIERNPSMILHVDHIKPRLTHPKLALDISNLQVLCAGCNREKGNKIEDWRTLFHLECLNEYINSCLSSTLVVYSTSPKVSQQ